MQVNPKTNVNKKFRPAHSLGDRVALQPLGADARLERRGFNMVLNGERCFGNQMEANTTISFICDPGAGAPPPPPPCLGLALPLSLYAAWFCFKLLLLACLGQFPPCCWGLPYTAPVSCLAPLRSSPLHC